MRIHVPQVVPPSDNRCVERENTALACSLDCMVFRNRIQWCSFTPMTEKGRHKKNVTPPAGFQQHGHDKHQGIPSEHVSLTIAAVRPVRRSGVKKLGREESVSNLSKICRNLWRASEALPRSSHSRRAQEDAARTSIRPFLIFWYKGRRSRGYGSDTSEAGDRCLCLMPGLEPVLPFEGHELPITAECDPCLWTDEHLA